MQIVIEINEARFEDIQRIADVQLEMCHFQTAEQIIAKGVPIEQEPCEDWYDVPSDEMTLGQARRAVKDLRKKLSEHLEQEPKWIPVSERLPEDRELVMFSTKTDRVFEGRYFDDNTNRQWYAFRDEAFAWNNVVTAWMPLPKPYEPQESEETKWQQK